MHMHDWSSFASYAYLCLWSAAAKFFWFLFFMFLTLVYFNFYGIACVALTPNLLVAAVLSSAFYGLFNLFAGFVAPKPTIPGWWIGAVRVSVSQYAAMC